MADQEVDGKSPDSEADKGSTRRSVLVGTGAFLVGAVAGRASSGSDSGSDDSPQSAPPLPWNWANIDPMEAGTRTYNAYLENGG